MTMTYRFQGRVYKTVNGLSRALFADSGCDSHSMVMFTASGDREIVCYRGRGAEQVIVARYFVSPPKAACDMTVARVRT
jgi:hypothetical protein